MLSQRDAAQLKLIMKICLLPDARRTHWNRAFTASGRPLDPGIHCVRTHWIRGFMTFRLVRCTRTVRRMVSV
jgi:hypothetical protein